MLALALLRIVIFLPGAFRQNLDRQVNCNVNKPFPPKEFCQKILQKNSQKISKQIQNILPTLHFVNFCIS